MGLPRRQFRRLARSVAPLLISIIFISVLAASAQEARTIKVVVPFPPGGAMDVLGRVLAEEIGRAHGPSMVIENRPGAGTVIATEIVSRAPPDGNTLLMPANSFVINPFLHKLNYDPLTSFEPICYLVRSPTVIVDNPPSHVGQSARRGAHQTGRTDNRCRRSCNLIPRRHRAIQA